MRQTLYKPEYCEQLINHMENGYSFDSFAARVKVGKRTLWEWVERHEEFENAKEIGRSLSRLHWEQIGKEGMRGEIRGFIPVIWIFWMKNCFGWRDKSEDQEKASANFLGEALAKHLSPDMKAKLRLVARDNKKR